MVIRFCLNMISPEPISSAHTFPRWSKLLQRSTGEPAFEQGELGRLRILVPPIQDGRDAKHAPLTIRCVAEHVLPGWAWPRFVCSQRSGQLDHGSRG
jgi:hypothetical protein